MILCRGSDCADFLFILLIVKSFLPAKMRIGTTLSSKTSASKACCSENDTSSKSSLDKLYSLIGGFSSRLHTTV